MTKEEFRQYSELQDKFENFEFIKNARPKDGQKCIVVDEDHDVFIATYIEHEDPDDLESQSIWEVGSNTYDVYSDEQWVSFNTLINALIKLGLKI